MRTMNASDFKAKCLAVLDEVARTRQPVAILKRGRPVALLGPPSLSRSRYPQEGLAGTVTVLGDIVAPVQPVDSWNAARGKAT